MELQIKTKFSVNDLVISKYQKIRVGEKEKNISLCCFEIIEIHTVTCMAGTQVFYDVRAIHGLTHVDYIEGKREQKFVDFSIGSNSRGEYSKVREDEIVEAPKEITELILNK